MPVSTPAGRDAVALVLAIGVAMAVNTITVAVLLDALLSEGPGLSDNATQVLTGAFGGVLGVLAAHLGYRAGVTSADDSRPPASSTRQTAPQVGRPDGEATHLDDVTDRP